MDNAIVDFSHFSQLPPGNTDSELDIRGEALDNAISTVIDEAKKYGFDYWEIIFALGKYAHNHDMKTVERLLDKASREAYKVESNLQNLTSRTLQKVNSVDSSQTAINQFLNNLQPFHRAMVQEAVSISLDQGQLSIWCVNGLHLDALLNRHKHLAKAAQPVDLIKRILLITPEERIKFSVFYAGSCSLEDYQTFTRSAADYLIDLCVAESYSLRCLRQCQIYQSFRQEIGEVVLAINCPDKSIAQILCLHKETISAKADILGMPKRRYILLRGNAYDAIRSRMNETEITDNLHLRERAEQYSNILRGFADDRTTAYLIDANSLKYLDVATSNPRRLNRTQSQLIGNSMNVNDPAIGEPRLYWCKKAIADGENKKFSYSYHDPANSLLWHFESRIIFIPGGRELICLVSDPLDAIWQTHYWQNLCPKRGLED